MGRRALLLVALTCFVGVSLMSAAASSTIAVVLPDGEMPEPVESESSLDEPAEDEATVAASQLSGPDACFDRPEITAAEGHESHNSSRVFRPPIA